MTIAVILWVAIGTLSANAEEDAGSPDEARRARVFAKVGDAVITVGDLEDGINERSPYARKRFEDPEIVRQYADERVKAELLLQGAERLGYEDDPDVEAYLDRMILQLFMRREIEEAKPVESITDEEVAAYYDEHPEEFRRPEMRRAAHIVVGSREEASDLIQDLRAGASEKFGTIAKQRSLDTETKLRGGDLLYFTKDGRAVGTSEDAVVDPALVAAAFRLADEGDITGKPVDLGEGKWSVLRLTAIRPERVERLDDARNAIRRRMWREDRKEALEALVAKLRAELAPTVHGERVDPIVLEAAKKRVEPQNQ